MAQQAMTPRLIHDCPYCGRRKFADETLPCCEDDLFAMRLEWQRQKDVRDNWGKPLETRKRSRQFGFGPTIEEDFGQ